MTQNSETKMNVTRAKSKHMREKLILTGGADASVRGVGGCHNDTDDMHVRRHVSAPPSPSPPLPPPLPPPPVATAFGIQCVISL
jgi:hypothetical protein